MVSVVNEKRGGRFTGNCVWSCLADIGLIDNRRRILAGVTSGEIPALLVFSEPFISFIILLTFTTIPIVPLIGETIDN